MPEFGKRNASIAVKASIKSGAPNLSAALDVAKTGRLPYWAKIGPVRLVIGMVAIAAAYVFCFLPYAGNIWRDQRLAGSWQAAYDMRAMDGKCTRHNFLVTNCSAKIKSLAEPGRAATDVTFMMAFASGDGERLVPVRSRVDASVVTIAYAAENELWNRTLTFIVLTVMMAATFLVCAHLLLRGRYQGGSAYRELVAALASLQAQLEASQPRAHRLTPQHDLAS